MSIDNILTSRANRDITSAMKKMADGKLNLTVTPAVQIPDRLDVRVLNPVDEVRVSNLGDVLRSLALLGKGIDQLSKSVDKIKNQELSSPTINIPEFPEMPDMGDLAKAIKDLKLEIKKLPKNTVVDAPTIKIPKSFKVENFDELKRGFVAINDNLVKLAEVVRENRQETESPERDDSAVISAVERVENAIKSMVFPIPTATTPSYKASDGTTAVSVVLDSRGRVPVAEQPADVDVSSHTNYVKKYYTNAGAVTDGIIWSPAAGKRWHLVSLHVQTSADATITIEDDLAAGDSAVVKGEYKAGSGFFAYYGEQYPLASGEDAADLLITTSAGNVYVTATGYEV